MKTLLRHSASLALLAALAPLATPAAQDQADLRARYEEKLSHDFVGYGGWITDYDEARAKAKAENKVLFVYFSRSYAP